MRSAALLLACGAFAAHAQDYPVPSFDCANTTTEQELHICRTPRLAELDGKFGYLQELAVRTSKNREQAVNDGDLWRANSRNPCQDDKCLETAYTARIAELERIVASQPPIKALPGWVVAGNPFPKPAEAAPSLPLPPPMEASPSPAQPSKPAQPERVQSHDIPDDEDDDEGNPWTLYAVIGGFLLFAAVVFLVVSRGSRPARR
ncbi:MAG TPA: hypothetical protein VGI57_14720 [Usitatibacter sp.]